LSYKTIRLEIVEHVAVLTFNRPDKLNALTPALFREAIDAIDAALSQGARALVITGEGRAFSSGADLTGEGTGGFPADLGAVIDAAYNPFARKLAALDIPVITAVNGPAVGAGCGFALSGDIVVMARSAYLLLSFVNIGLVPDAGATWAVAKSAGRAKALEMALLGEKMSAQEAHDAGLVARVVDDEALMGEAMSIAHRLAAGPTMAIGLIRKQVAAALTSTFAETLDIERDNQSAAGRTADFREAVIAFAQKRAPTFEGR